MNWIVCSCKRAPYPKSFGSISLGNQDQWNLGAVARYSESEFERMRTWRAWEAAPTARHELYRSLWELMHPLAGQERRTVIDLLRTWAGADSAARPSHRLLSADELRALADGDLIEIGAHTMTHPALGTLPASAQWDEIQQSKIRLEDVVGRPVSSFAYPFGRRCDYLPETVSIVRDVGFARACSNFPGVVEPSTDRFQSPRVQYRIGTEKSFPHAWNGGLKNEGLRPVALIEFVEVSFAEVNPEEIRGYHLDVPEAADQTEGDTIEIIGWVLGGQSPVVAVEVTVGSRLLRRVPINVPRADVAAQYPDLANSKQSGFKAKVQMGGAGELRLLVQAVLEDQKRVQLVVIHAQRRWREQHHENTPLVSVIIPCYGQAHFLAETIESVLAQRYPHFEVVVIDDGSVDNTEEVALQWPRVRYVRQNNSGLAAARNTGLRRSLGDYVVFLDADDRLLPEALDAGLTAFAAHPESAFVVGHCRCITVDGMPLPKSEHPCVAGHRTGHCSKSVGFTRRQP